MCEASLPTDKKILVVDDEKVVRDFLTRFLKLKSLEVETAESGFAAIKLAEKEKFDLVFLDVRMPKIDGLQTFRRLKKLTPGSKYIMMTGYAVDDLLEQAKNEGAIVSLKKPFDIDELTAVLKTALGQ